MSGDGLGKDLVLHFDGACWPNPGGTSSCGWTIAVAGPDGEAVEVASDSRALAKGPGVTNNVAEWTALGFALRWLLDDGWTGGRLTIRGDSQLVINQLEGVWGCRDDRLRKLRARCLAILDELACEWTAEWVPRDGNARADALSVQAWEGAEGRPFPQLR